MPQWHGPTGIANHDIKLEIVVFAQEPVLADFGLSYAHEKNYTDGISLWTFGLAVIRLGF